MKLVFVFLSCMLGINLATAAVDQNVILYSVRNDAGVTISNVKFFDILVHPDTPSLYIDPPFTASALSPKQESSYTGSIGKIASGGSARNYWSISYCTTDGCYSN